MTKVVEANRVAFNYLVEVAHLIKNEKSLAIIDVLSRHKELCAGDIEQQVKEGDIIEDIDKIQQPIISQFLKKLREVGIISYNKVGKHRYYKLHFHPMQAIISAANIIKDAFEEDEENR